MITCGKGDSGRNDNSIVQLKFLENKHRVRETVNGRAYAIKAELMQPNGTHAIKVKNCFAFSKTNTSVQLIDDKG